MSDTTDTSNDQLVGMRGDQIVVVLPKSSMTRADAIRHAAWLVAIADNSPGHIDFHAALAAIENL